MNELTIGSGHGAAVSIGAPMGEHGGDSFTGDFERKVNFYIRGCVKEGSGKG